MINEWLAEKCNIPLDDVGYSEGMTDDEGQYYKWNYKDPRCMAVIEEVFKIATDIFDGPWRAFPRGDVKMTIKCLSEGDTPHLARIACIEAIYKASKEDKV